LSSFLLQPWVYNYTKANLVEAFRVPAASMEPTIKVGDYLYVAKWAEARTALHRWLLWRDDRQLFRRDVVAGTTVTIATDYNGFGSDVAPNGDVVYTRSGDIVLVHDAVATDVTADGGSPDDDAPAIDDAHVVYLSGRVAATSGRFIRLDDGATDLTLSGPLPLSDAFPPPLAEDGWIGYVKQSATVNQVWVRSPAGVDRQASATGLSGALPETLSPDGAVFFRVQARRFLATPPFGGATVDVGTRQGRGLFIDGGAYVIIGRSLLRVE
jgi:signal peptidase I